MDSDNRSKGRTFALPKLARVKIRRFLESENRMPTHEIVDFGAGPVDETQGIVFEGTLEQCEEWLDQKQVTRSDGKPRFMMQEIGPY